MGDDPTPIFSRSMIRPDDAIIAVMGVTGAGKSTFVSHFCNTAVVGHSLHSQTATVEVHTARVDGHRVIFIDTPGFDDDRRPNTVILREIADWLGSTYIKNIKLAGIVYLHGIQDTRMKNSAKTSLRLFRKLCGSDSSKTASVIGVLPVVYAHWIAALASVVLATTQWSAYTDPHYQAQHAREKELIKDDEFWAEMIQQKAHVERQNEGYVSALRIVRYLLQQRPRRGLDLTIQKEMASGMLLEKTEAGLELEQRLSELRARYERDMEDLRRDFEEARRNNDERMRAEIEKDHAALLERIEAERRDRERLRVDLNTLRQQREEELRAAAARLDAEMQSYQKKADQGMLRVQEQHAAREEQLLREADEAKRKADEATAKRNEEKRKLRELKARIRQAQECCIL